MTRTRSLATVVVALVASLAVAGGVSAHAGEYHTSSALGGWAGQDGIALLGVVLATGVVFWLMNQDNRHHKHHEHLDRHALLSDPRASKSGTSEGIPRQGNSNPTNPLVASRPLPPAHLAKAGNRSHGRLDHT